MKANDLIEEAIEFAKSKGISIVRGPVFIRTIDSIISCNIWGAILIKIGKEDLVSDRFDPSWLKVICDYLEEDSFWFWKTSYGFNYGNELTIIKVKKDKDKTNETEEKDKISKYANKLALRVCGRK
jgi:hypothetical protein